MQSSTLLRHILFLILLLTSPLGAATTTLRLSGHLHEENLSQAKEQVEALTQGDTLAIELKSNSGELEQLLSLARSIHSAKQQKQIQVVLFLNEEAIGPAALLPFLATELQTSNFLSWGDIPSGVEPPPPTNLLRSQVGSFFNAEQGQIARLAEAMVDPAQAAKLPLLDGKEERLILNRGQMQQLNIPHNTTSQQAFRSRFSEEKIVTPTEKETANFSAIKPSPTGPNRFGYIAVDQRDSMISESTWLFVKTALDGYKENPPVAIILELNTPGGQVFAAQKIADALHEIDRDYGIPVIAVIDNWAISAGAMLAYSCRYILAVEDASMGAAAPVFAAGGAVEEAPEKINSALRADMRNRAGFFDRNQDIAAAMVDKDIILVERFGKVVALSSEEEIRRGGSNPDKVISGKGKLLTLTGDELLKYGIANALIEPTRLSPLSGKEEQTGDYSGKKMQLFHQPFFRDIANPQIDAHRLDWKGKFLSLLTHPAVGSFLVLGMMLGFYMEMSTPGFGLAGSIALICLCLTLLASFALQALSWLELVLMAIGALLILADLALIPTFGLLGTVGGALFLIGLFGLLIPGLESISYDTDSATVNAAGEAAIQRLGWLAGGLVAGILSIFALARYITPDLAVLNRFVLQGEQEGYRSGPTAEELPPTGTKGTAATTLRPAGKVLINEQLYDGTSSGQFIDKDTAVEVVGHEGSHILVQKAEENA